MFENIKNNKIKKNKKTQRDSLELILMHVKCARLIKNTFMENYRHLFIESSKDKLYFIFAIDDE